MLGPHGTKADSKSSLAARAEAVRAPDSTLEALWKNVLDNWQNDAAHHAFLDYCQSRERLDEAAVRYRGMKGDHERGAAAEKRLTGVLMLAMSKLEVSRAEPKANASALTKLLLIAFFTAGSLLVLAYLLRTGSLNGALRRAAGRRADERSESTHSGIVEVFFAFRAHGPVLYRPPEGGSDDETRSLSVGSRLGPGMRIRSAATAQDGRGSAAAARARARG
jgi:hypothetical protein